MAREGITVLATFLAVGLCTTSPLASGEYACPEGVVIVKGGGDRSPAICRAAAEATKQLASCNLILTQPVTVEITRKIPSYCHGLYDCDEALIQLLPLEGYAEDLSGNSDSPFAHLGPEVYFDSVLRHELAHAALSAMPCPYGSCPVTREFVAYTMQIRFLPDADRAPFDQRVANAERSMTRDDLSAISLMMVPYIFIENAYTYLTQQADPCRLVGAIAKGEVVFDVPPR